jgi:glutamate N-acetyltransferase / amino-acid N-acetyltransferase
MTVTTPQGFVAAGVACGIKASGDPDLALVATADGKPVAAAGVFTANKSTAAPVVTTKAHLAATNGHAVAVILNSGNANAATGASGLADAQATCEVVAGQLRCAPDEVLVCSTGLIGIPLPIDTLLAGVEPLAAALRDDGGSEAAEAIMTTDTVAKEVVVEGDGFTVGGIAKGAAMLAPNMATMLAVLTTDADASPEVLQAALRAGVATSFNTMSVDGCMSTNDTVLLFASGLAGPVDEAELFIAVAEACSDLARQMVGDAEGATKVVEVRVVGAASDDDAAKAARRVAESNLCKCSWYGQDPYWGRIVSEIGSSGADFDPDRVSVAYGGIAVCKKGVACMHDVTALDEVMSAPYIEIVADLGLGRGEASILTNDLTHAYIDENMTTS